MTEERLQALRALCDAATSEPWDAGNRWVSAGGVPLTEVRPLSGMGKHNAAFIAEARTALPEALKEIERQASTIAALRKLKPLRRIHDLRKGTTLFNTWENFKHDRARLERMVERWHEAGGVCCPGCMFGAEMREIEEKQQRRFEFLLGKGYDCPDPRFY